MNFIVVDLEFNQYFDFGDGRGRDEPLCQFEIIQIGAVKLDEQLNETGRLNLYVKPSIFQRMHPFVQKITGIDYGMLRRGKSFEEAYRELGRFLGSEKHILCVWGSGDVRLLYKNVLFYKLNSMMLSGKFINVQQLASVHFGMSPNACIGLGAAVEKLEIEQTSEFHNALNDACYTAEIFKKLYTGKETVLDFNLNQLKQQNYAKSISVNSSQLFDSCEKELRRKLNDREKELVLHVYAAGQRQLYRTAENVKANPIQPMRE